MQQNQLAIPISIVIAGALIAGAMYFAQTKNSGALAEGNGQGKNIQDLIPVPEITNNDWVRGNRNAPLVIVEYSDAECPFCRIFHTTMQKIANDFAASGNVAWVYRHMPLAQLHQKAYDEAVAMECAGILGGNDVFWTYADALFAKTPSNDGLDHALLTQFATQAGLDAKKFNECRAGAAAKKVVDDTLASAQELGIQGTPHSYILYKGEQISIDGAQPYEVVKKVVETLLKK